MSQDNISTEHRTEDGEQVTEKRVTVDGTEYRFEGEPGGEYEAVGGATEAAYETLFEHLGDGETLLDEAGEEFTPIATTSTSMTDEAVADE